jgi:DNA-binding CsgD family transcriptional regulator
MKNEILRLRSLGYSYKAIQKELGCALSTISYHCINNGVNLPKPNPNKLSNELITKIKQECLIKNKNLVAKELGLSEKVVYKYGNGINKLRDTSIKKQFLIRKSTCLYCGKETDGKKFCDAKCNGQHRHNQAYFDFLNNNEKYCVGYYTAKNFKDFFLKEQNNKCAICGIEPIWMNKEMVFVLDHIDGDCSNNKRKNLRLICPNCDAQTDTFKSKTKHSKRRDYIKENIIKNIKKEYGGNLAG